MRLLSDLLVIPDWALISIVGAGGKSTTMYTLARELAQEDKRVITTTTTNIYPPSPEETDACLLTSQTPDIFKSIQNAWEHSYHITVASHPIAQGKLAGLAPDQPYQLLRESGAHVVIVEADGARHLFIKAPAAHEPVVPPETNLALIVMSAEAIDKPLNAEIAHRPEHIAAVTGISLGDTLTPGVIATLMTSEQGALKGLPESARRYLLITHAAQEKMKAMQELAYLVYHSGRITGVLISPNPGEWSIL